MMMPKATRALHQLEGDSAARPGRTGVMKAQCTMQRKEHPTDNELAAKHYDLYFMHHHYITPTPTFGLYLMSQILNYLSVTS